MFICVNLTIIVNSQNKNSWSHPPKVLIKTSLKKLFATQCYEINFIHKIFFYIFFKSQYYNSN